MAKEPQSGAVYWIDHYVVPTNDLLRWQSFYTDVLGAQTHHLGGLTTQERQRRGPIRCFMHVGQYHSNGGFLQNELLPPSEGLGKGLPRYGYFIRPQDVDEHLRRLDRLQVPHTDPVRTSEDGEEGTVIYFEDPDHNQYEFWAPVHMPEGAMESDNALGVGRISSVTQESRDIERTAEFYARFCGMDPVRSEDIASGTLALALWGGGRLVFKQTPELGPRAGGHNRWLGRHTALTVRNDEFFDLYRRLWDALPESEYLPYSTQQLPDEQNAAPRTEMHGVAARGERITQGDAFDRGTFFYDWDANDYHYVGGVAVGRSMVRYEHGFSGDVAVRRSDVMGH